MSNNRNLKGPRLLTTEETMKIAMPFLGPNGAFTIGINSKGKYFTKAPKNLIDFFQKQTSEFAEKEFIIYKNERYTYSEVWEKCKRLAIQLQTKFNIKVGDRVAISMRNYPEWCFSFIAIILCGGIAVPLNSWWKEKELEYGLRDSGSKVIICDEARFKYLQSFYHKSEMKLSVILTRMESDHRNLQNYNKSVFHLNEIIESANFNHHNHHHNQHHNQQQQEQQQREEEFLRIVSDQVRGEDVAVIMYTSGTTGEPKGVMLDHIGIVNQMEVLKLLNLIQEKATELLINDGCIDREVVAAQNVEQHVMLCGVPLFHVTASHHLFLQSYVVGRKLVLMYKWDSNDALQIIEKERVTQFTGVPTMGADLMENPRFNEYDTSSLLSLGAGGAATPTSQIPKIPKFFKNALPSVAYGLTETNGAICMNAGFPLLVQPDSVGSPFPIVDVKIAPLDADSSSSLSSSSSSPQSGELLIKSNLVMKGYWNKLNETKEVLSDDGWFRTGDIAFVDERNRIYIVDRQKDIIIRGGENISCNEVERLIYTHPAVRECSVFGLPDDRLGEIVAAMILLKSHATSEDIVHHLHGKLANFKIPNAKHIYFTDVPLPRGPTGKILKRSIRKHILDNNNNHSKLPSKL